MSIPQHQFLRHLQHLSTPILAISACNGSPELASLLTLRAAIVFVLKTSRFYARLLPAIAADAENGVDEELERIARAGQVRFDLLGKLRRPLLPSPSRVGEPCAQMPQQHNVDLGFREAWHNSWTLARL